MIPLFKVYMSPEAKTAAGEVLDSGYIGQGPKVEEFEKRLRMEFFEGALTCATNSATSAEHLALHMLKKPRWVPDYLGGHGGSFRKDPYELWPGIEDGDEVLASPLTCTATNWPILANGYKIKWVDVDEQNLNMDLDDLARKITEKTKVIMLVHWGGYPVDLDRLREIQLSCQDAYGFQPMVIEDCAHAFGSAYKGHPIGCQGNICTFSFQAIKHLTSGDGGALVSPYHDFHSRAKLLRWYGIDRDNNSKDFRCVHPQTLVRFVGEAKGVPISKVVKEKKEGEVLCYSERTGKLEPAKIVGWHQNNLGKREFIKITTHRLDTRASTIVTGDHEIYSKDRGWVEARTISEGEYILTSRPKPNQKQKELILGSLLGDGRISHKESAPAGVFYEGHSVKQEDYLRYKCRALESLGVNFAELDPDPKRRRPNGSVVLTTRSLPSLGEIREFFYKKERKVVPIEEIENNWSDFLLAVWFMDDGSTSVHNTVAGIGYSAQIATNSFSEKEVAALVGLLNRKGYSCKKASHEGSVGFRIFFDKKGTLKLITDIARYVPQSMRYKVGHNPTVEPFDEGLWDLGEADSYFDRAVIKKYTGSSYDKVYCLEVEHESHNFSTSAIIVKNCEADVAEWGFKFHMNDISASIGLANMDEVRKNVIAKHKANAAYYNQELAGVDGVELLENEPERESAYWIYTLKIKGRDGFMEFMKEKGVAVSRVHERNDLHTCVKKYRALLPSLEKVLETMICIPVGWWVTEEQREYIVTCIKEWGEKC